MVGQGGAVAAGPGLDPGPVQLFGHLDRVAAGQVERDQRGAPCGVAGPVDGDPGDGGQPVERAGVSCWFHAATLPIASCTALRSITLPVPNQTGRLGDSARSSSMRTAWADTMAPKMLGVPAAY